MQIIKVEAIICANIGPLKISWISAQKLKIENVSERELLKITSKLCVRTKKKSIFILTE